MHRNRLVLTAALAALVALLPLSAWADVIPSRQVVEAEVTPSFSAPQGTYVEVFEGTGLGGGVSISASPPHGGLAASLDHVALHMSVSAQQCCTVHSFVLGPWTGNWSLDGQDGDTISGTATGSIDSGCVSDPTGFSCLTPPTIGPGVTFALTITGGTGRYAGVSGSGTLSGSQTPVSVSSPPALFVGQLALALS